MSEKIVVKINMERFWQIGQPVLQHIYVGETLRKAGVPVVGGLEIQGVEHGRLLHYNEDGHRVYEWEPGPDSPKPVPAAFNSFFG